MKRRDFLKTVAAVSAASVVPVQARGVQRLPRVALQLYSIREAMQENAAAALERVAAMGYTAIETAFWPEGMTLADAARMLRDTGLEPIACHIEIPTAEYQQTFVETAEAFDCDRMVWHGWPEDTRYQTTDGIKELANIYNEAWAFADANGLQFGLHNHWWEMEDIPDVGIPYYVLLELIEPGIFFELDTFWITVGGQDAAKVIADFGARATLLHVKDGTVLSEDGPMVALGDGMVDFPSIAAAGKGNVEYMIVELDDCETDMFEAVDRSFQYLTSNGLAEAG